MPNHHDDRRKLQKRASTSSSASASTFVDDVSCVQEGQVTPCGACKFLRRKCTNECIFAPYFGSDQGAARFAVVHKVFGTSNVSKLLLQIPMNLRQDAVTTISYEAQARLSDPIYGCIPTILSLQQQVATLQAELAMVKRQVIDSRLPMTNTPQTTQQHHQDHISNIGFDVMLIPHHQLVHHHQQQPAYSNNSSTSNNLLNMNTSATNITDHGYVSSPAYNVEFTHVANASTAPSPRSLDLFRLPKPSHDDDEDDKNVIRNRIASSNNFFR